MQTVGPMLAIVVDHIRTQLSGRVVLGAFRTCSESDSTANNNLSSDIPEDKIKDFGLHYKKYYSLDIEYFISRTDLDLVEICWTQYWKTLLASDQMIENKEHILRSMKDQLIKTQKMKNQLGASSQILGRRDENSDTQNRVNDLTKYALELIRANHQDCIKSLTFCHSHN